jgi:hypothetical protein
MSTVPVSTPGGNVSMEDKSQTALLIFPIGGSAYRGFVWERNGDESLAYQTMKNFHQLYG